MSSRIENNIDFIKALDKITPYKRARLIKSASEDNSLALVEIAQNTLAGKLNLNTELEKKLRRHRKSIRHLAKSTPTVKSKKKFLLQKGGFLPHLVTPLLSLLGTVAGKIVISSLNL